MEEAIFTAIMLALFIVLFGLFAAGAVLLWKSVLETGGDEDDGL